jgi:hypothetical protein
MTDVIAALACFVGIVLLFAIPIAISIRIANRRRSEQAGELARLVRDFIDTPSSATAQSRVVEFAREMPMPVPLQAGALAVHANTFAAMVMDPSQTTVLNWILDKSEINGLDRTALFKCLGAVVKNAASDADSQSRYIQIVSRIKPPITSAEASWLYQLSLDYLEGTRGATGAKALALQLGRLSYSAARPDRRPTVYDEQAIGNDIGSRCPSDRPA